MRGAAVVRAIGDKASGIIAQLLEKRLDMRSVIDILVSQIKGDDLATVGVNANVQLALGAALCGQMLFKQSFARAAQLQARAVDDEMELATMRSMAAIVHRQSAARRLNVV